MAEAPSKVCLNCGERKPLSEYWWAHSPGKEARYPQGIRQPRCKACERKRDALQKQAKRLKRKTGLDPISTAAMAPLPEGAPLEQTLRQRALLLIVPEFDRLVGGAIVDAKRGDKQARKQLLDIAFDPSLQPGRFATIAGGLLAISDRHAAERAADPPGPDPDLGAPAVAPGPVGGAAPPGTADDLAGLEP